ncbi:MAG: 3-hydroxyisobutyrate dehydrogenase [Actinomycetota bacterium]|jgi:3-hydroxyisobutyrate dehydrogenase-like beta-hydroxyacid dehydrogenase|nr:3-hydroxyisobutyrate dehydrogenase [Actinomycetota bacterium]
MNTDQRIGFIGLGAMGEPMAANVAKAGFPLTVFDVRPEPLERLEGLGAAVAPSARALAERCDIVLLAVVDDAQVDATLHDGGVLDALAPGSVVVVHSTIHPSTCRRLAALAAERDIGFLDAPISGGANGAEAGTLAIMVGGDAATLETCRDVLDAMAGNVFHVGGPGMGEVAKITNNVVLAVVLQGTLEGLRLAKWSGIDERTMLEILRVSAGESWVVRNWEAIQTMAEAHPQGRSGLARLTYKDLAFAQAIGHDVGAPLPVTALAAQLVEQPLIPIGPAPTPTGPATSARKAP